MLYNKAILNSMLTKKYTTQNDKDQNFKTVKDIGKQRQTERAGGMIFISEKVKFRPKLIKQDKNNIL